MRERERERERERWGKGRGEVVLGNIWWRGKVTPALFDVYLKDYSQTLFKGPVKIMLYTKVFLTANMQVATSPKLVWSIGVILL